MKIFKYLVVTGALLLQTGASAYKADPSEFLVQGLEEIEPAFASFEGKMYAGLMPFHLDDEEEGEFMFWYFEPDHPEVPDALSIYLSGGPGCSSIGTGNFFGSGPVTVHKFPAGMVEPTSGNDPLEPNPHSWVKTTPLIYVEQPATTGFSYGPLPEDEDDVSRDMYNWLTNFFETFQYLKHRDLFLFGGSYSGMNVPAIARKIYRENKRKNENERINIKGIALGNAWLDPKIQGPATVDFAWAHGMIDITTRDTFHKYWRDCLRGKPVPAPMHPFTTPDECGMDEIVIQAAGAELFTDQAPNAYDISTWDPYNILGDHGTINKFYNNPKVQDALHTRKIKWHGCVEEGHMLNYDKPESVVPYVGELLDEANIRVLFYNGDRDLLCCHTGTEMLLETMQWSNRSGWKNADRGVWMVDNQPAGYAKKLGNLEYVTVYNSGHMVYYNQPARCLNLVTRFLKGQSHLDVETPSYPRGSDEPQPIGLTVKLALVGFLIGAGLFLIWKFLARSRKHRQYDAVSVTDNNEKTYGTVA